MKFLGKLNINSEKILKNEELVNLKGGYSGYGGDNGGGDNGGGGGTDCTATSKTSACTGKSEGDGCCWKYNGNDSSGKCAKIAPNYVLHCSDL